MVRCLVTGGTGFIGRFLVQKLLSQGADIHVVVRKPESAAFQSRLKQWNELAKQHEWSGSVSVLQGDLSQADVFSDPHNCASYTDVYHLAAIYDLDAQNEAVIQTNVQGSENLFNQLISGGFNGKVHYISSIAVAGDFEGTFTEDMFDEGQTHSHIYHRSKFESEACARKYRDDHKLDIRIYRPSAVIGHSQTGEMDKIDGPYYMFLITSFLKRWLPRWAPLVLPKLEGRLDVVTVDYVVDALYSLSQSRNLGDQYCFHLTNPDSPSLDRMFKAVLKSADAPKIRFSIPLRGLKKAGIGMKQLSLVKELKAIQIISEQLLSMLSVPSSVFSAMMPDVEFNASETLKLLESEGIKPVRFESVIDTLWDYYNRHLDPEKNRIAIAKKVFANKNILITGGSSGIGLASAAKALEYGANVILVARHADKLEESVAYLTERQPDMQGSIDTFVCDIANLDACDELVVQVNEQLGHVDVLFNNAGRSIRRSISKSQGRFHDLERTMQLNYFGAARLMLGFLPSMVERGQGHILHSSSMGTMAATPRFGPYMASKSATDTLMDSLAAEFTDKGVSFTSIKFPLVKTNMVAPTSEYKDADLVSPEAAAQMFIDAVLDRPRKQLSGMGVFLGTLSLYAPELVTRIYNYLYQVWPDEKGEYPEMAFDRALLTSFVPHSPL